MEEKATERQDHYKQTEQGQGNKSMKGYIFAGIILLACVPVFYLMFMSNKKTEVAEPVKPQATVPAQPSLASLEAAAEKDPSFQNLINLGVVYQQNGQYRKSIPVFEKAIALQPGNAIAYNNLSVGLIMSRQFDAAEQALAKAIQLDPNLQLAKNNLAWMEDERKKFNDELQKLESVPEGDRTPKQMIDLGLLYYAKGDYQKSVDVLKACVDKDPGNAMAYNNMGTSYMFLNDHAQALTAFKKAVELDEKEQLYKNNLKWAEDELNAAPKAE